MWLSFLKNVLRWSSLQNSWRRYSKKASASSNCTGARKILIVDELLPDPMFGAGYPRAYKIVKQLADAGYLVTVFALYGARADVRRVGSLLPASVKLLIKRNDRGLRSALSDPKYDVVIISRPAPMKLYIRLIGKSINPRLIYDAETLVAERQRIKCRLFGEAWTDAEYDRVINDEISLTEPASTILAVTPNVAAEFAARTNKRVVVVSHSVSEPISQRRYDQRAGLLFVGRMTGPRTESPNVDSVLWFVGQVLPVLDSILGFPVAVTVVGTIDNQELVALASTRIKVAGSVRDLDAFFEQARVFIAPTRFAAGLPLKVVESMARGLPAATTQLLKDEMGLPNEPSGSRKPEYDFAHEIARLYLDEHYWYRARNAGLKLVADNYSTNAFAAAITDALRIVNNALPV